MGTVSMGLSRYSFLICYKKLGFNRHIIVKEPNFLTNSYLQNGLTFSNFSLNIFIRFFWEKMAGIWECVKVTVLNL